MKLTSWKAAIVCGLACSLCSEGLLVEGFLPTRRTAVKVRTTHTAAAKKASNPVTLQEHNNPVGVEAEFTRLRSPHRVNPQLVLQTSRRSIALHRSVIQILAGHPEPQPIRQRVRESVRIRV